MTDASTSTNPKFRRWIGGFRKRALAVGIRATVLDSALKGLIFNESVIDKDRNQSEFTKQIWDYLDSAVSEKRLANGKGALGEHGDLLDQIEARFGVEKEIVVAIWGLESAYGEFRGDIPTIQALATLAFDARRGEFFEQQLIAALRILQAGDVSAEKMTGSWAGAMGHTQFIPTSYLAYAKDFTGDGKRDIWSEDPTDALASTAAYLARFGWEKRQPWGIEVTLPDGFDYSQSGTSTRKSVTHWNDNGVRDTAGRELPDHGRSSILLPAGSKGAAFIVFDNFRVIKRYNAADAYAIAVGHLADRITGAAPIKAGWPREDRALSFDERVEMQRLLTRAGYNTMGHDGIIGPNTIAALRAFQAAKDLVPDGYASLKLLNQLR